MKKTKLIAIVLIGLTFALSSCKKDKKEIAIPKNSWKIGNTIYKGLQVLSEEVDEGYLFMSSTADNENYILVGFKSKPSAGSYSVLFNNSDEIRNDQVVVMAIENKNNIEYATMAKSGTVQVSSYNGKITIKLAKTEAGTKLYDVDNDPISLTTMEVNLTEN